MITLGISCSHDGTLSIVRDGIHEYSIAEERINRIKSYIGFPFKSLRHAIDSGKIDPTDVHSVAVPLASYPARSAWMYAFITTEDKLYYDIQNESPPNGFSLPDDGWSHVRTDDQCEKYVRNKIQKLLSEVGINAPIEFYDHHLCHASSAYFSSGLSEALAITLDGEGDGLSASVSICRGNQIQRISSTSRDFSAGYLYSEVTKRCGFKVSRHEGKITGLAAYGDPLSCLHVLTQHVKVKDGTIYFKGVRRNNRLEKVLRKLTTPLGHSRSFGAQQIVEKCSEISDADLAASMQALLESTIAEIVNYWVEKTGITNIVLAGGVFANVKFNQKIGELPSVQSLFVFPDMGDGGGAYGAAMYSNSLRNDRQSPLAPISNVYLGPSFSDAQILDEIKSFTNIDYRKSDDIALESAQHIANKKVVGWFQGRMEYGPRALGNRSILASPIDPSINDWLNHRMQRTEFMPFAPSCLYEYADEIFEIPKPSLKRPAEFMTITFGMKEYWAKKAPAVSHVDQTARPQLVRKDVNPLYHRLLSEHLKITGIPLVINTSFNVHEEPIVCNPSEALRALESSMIDILAIGNYIVTRK